MKESDRPFCIISYDHYCTCVLVPGGKTTWLPMKLMYMLGVTVKVTVISRLLVAERYRGMDTLFGTFLSWKVKLAFTKPTWADRDWERERERKSEGIVSIGKEFHIATAMISTYEHRVGQSDPPVFLSIHSHIHTCFHLHWVDVHCFLGTRSTGFQLVDRNFHHKLQA